MKTVILTINIFMMIMAGTTICFLKNATIYDVHNSESLKLIVFVLLADCIFENILRVIRYFRS